MKQDQACWDYWAKLKSNFKNVYIDFSFTYEELQKIGDALNYALKAFNNDIDLFKGAYGYFSIISAPPLYGGMTLFGTIYLGYSTFYDKNGKDQNDAVRLILHEMSHIFDYRSGNGSPGASNEFNGSFNSSPCTPGFLGCTSDSASTLYKVVNFLSGGRGTYSSTGKTSGYGQNSSIDDFADSMAVEILKVNGIIANIQVDDSRLKFIIKILESSTIHSR